MHASRRIEVLVVAEREPDRAILGEAGLRVVAVTSSLEEAVGLVAYHRPDVILLDGTRGDALGAARHIQRLCPTPLVLIARGDAGTPADEAGVGALVAPPLGAESLARAVAIALARHEDLLKLMRLSGVGEGERAQDVEGLCCGIAEHARDGVLLSDERGTIVEWTVPLARLTGIPREAALGRSLWDANLPRLADGEGPAGVVLDVQRALERLFGAGEPPRPHAHAEITVQRPGGSPRALDLAAFALRTAGGTRIGAILCDARERERAEAALLVVQAELERRASEGANELARALAALKESEERFHHLSDATFEGILIHAEGHILAANASSGALFGLKPEALVGRSVYDLVIPKDRDLVRTKVSTHDRGPYNASFLRADGRPFPAEVRAREIVLHGQNARVAAIRDVSERIQAERAEREARAALENTNRKMMALCRVGLRAQETLDPGSVCALVTGELKTLGYESAVALVEGDDMVVRSVSLDERQLAEIRRLLDVDLDGYRLPVGQAEDLLTGAAPTFRDDPLPLILRAVPDAEPGAVRRVVRACRCGALALLPLHSRSTFVGCLCIWSDRVRSGDLPALTAFAQELATALENARLFASVRVQGERLRELGARLQSTVEEERHAIAAELHDSVGQNLTALGINLSILRRGLSEGDGAPEPSLVRAVEDSIALIAQTTDRIRDIMADLRPPALDDCGLLAALRAYATRFRERTGLDVRVTGEDARSTLDRDVAISLFRIAQEALTNVAKHAHARAVQVHLEERLDGVSLTVADDGVGYDPEVAEDPEPRGWGLLTMRERTVTHGGTLRVDSHPGHGTVVTVEIPR